MELFCCENNQSDFAVVSQPDKMLLDDDRVITNLLDSETEFVLHGSYVNTVQTEITSDMRRILTTWMSEVCMSRVIFFL